MAAPNTSQKQKASPFGKSFIKFIYFDAGVTYALQSV